MDLDSVGLRRGGKAVAVHVKGEEFVHLCLLQTRVGLCIKAVAVHVKG